MADQFQSKLSQPDELPAVPLCPVGETQCVVIDQLMTLRHSVCELEQQVRTDTLTGLFNFRHFSYTLAQEMERTRRTEQSTALVMVDLDHFKRVNDSWGHEAGNQALIATAKVLRQTVRRLDIACRYGGEEFAIILPATDLIVATQVAERVRAGIEAEPVVIDGKDIALTASLGVEVYTSFHDDTPEQLVRRADSCLYQAKQQGRNRVCHGTVDVGRTDAAVSKEERELLSDFFRDDESSTVD